MNEKERNCVYVNEISSVFFNKYEGKHALGRKILALRRKNVHSGEKNVHSGEKYVHSDEKSLHLGEYFKLYFSKRALGGDFYIRKNRLHTIIVQLTGSCTWPECT